MEYGATSATPEPATARRAGLADVLLAAGGAMLFASLFIAWYGIAFSDEATEEIEETFESQGGGVAERFDLEDLEELAFRAFDQSAWQSFAFIDVVLVIVAAGAVALAVARLLGRTPALPVDPAMLLMVLGGLAVVLVLVRIAFTPNLEYTLEIGGEEQSVKVKDTDQLDVERRFWGPLLGALAALSILAGAVMAAGGRSALDRMRPRRMEQAPPGQAPPPPPPPPPAAS